MICGTMEPRYWGSHHSCLHISLCPKMPQQCGAPGQNLITINPETPSVVCLMQSVDSHRSASYSRGQQSLGMQLVLNKICWLNAYVNTASQDNEGIFSLPWLNTATAKWQLFRKILDQFTLAEAARITALSKSLCTSGNKVFPSLTSLKAFFSLQRGIHQLLISSHFHFLPGSSAHHFLFIKCA